MAQRDEALRRAEEYVKLVRDFFYHLMVYVVTCSMFVIIDVANDGGRETVLGMEWAYWVILFWGLGVAGHAISVFFGRKKVEALAAELRKDDELIRH